MKLNNIQACDTLIDWVREHSVVDTGKVYVQRLDVLRSLRRAVESYEEALKEGGEKK